MASKPKASSTKKSAASKTDKKVQKTQRERFIETAREIDADETGEAFERAVEVLIPPSKP